jgi:hypothetical protein
MVARILGIETFHKHATYPERRFTVTVIVRWDGGIHEGIPTRGPQRAARSVALVGIVAASAAEALAVLKHAWRTKYRDEPPSALIGLSHPY